MLLSDSSLSVSCQVMLAGSLGRLGGEPAGGLATIFSLSSLVRPLLGLPGVDLDAMSRGGSRWCHMIVGT